MSPKGKGTRQTAPRPHGPRVWHVQAAEPSRIIRTGGWGEALPVYGWKVNTGDGTGFVQSHGTNGVRIRTLPPGLASTPAKKGQAQPGPHAQSGQEGLVVL